MLTYVSGFGVNYFDLEFLVRLRSGWFIAMPSIGPGITPNEPIEAYLAALATLFRVYRIRSSLVWLALVVILPYGRITSFYRVSSFKVLIWSMVRFLLVWVSGRAILSWVSVAMTANVDENLLLSMRLELRPVTELLSIYLALVVFSY